MVFVGFRTSRLPLLVATQLNMNESIVTLGFCIVDLAKFDEMTTKLSQTLNDDDKGEPWSFVFILFTLSFIFVCLRFFVYVFDVVVARCPLSVARCSVVRCSVVRFSS